MAAGGGLEAGSGGPAQQAPATGGELGAGRLLGHVCGERRTGTGTCLLYTSDAADDYLTV